MKQFLIFLAAKEGKSPGHVNCIFCDDQSLLAINRRYLKHDFLTDVVSFSLSEQKGTADGEIYISVDRVRANAKTFNTTFQTELHRVLFHGMLHLCGHADDTAAKKKAMSRREDHYLDLYFQKRSTWNK